MSLNTTLSDLLASAKASSTPATMALSLEEEEEVLTSVSSVSSVATVSRERDTSGKYYWVDDYKDTSLSTVDELKNISVDSKQINITAETHSQYIPFKIPRYWDGIDLKRMSLVVHYENKDGGADNAVPINVEYDDEFVYFGWLIDGNVTAVKGEVKFEIQAHGLITIGGKEKNYIWKTRPNGKLNILESLTNEGMIEPDHDWITNLFSALDLKMDELATTAGQAVIDATEQAQIATEAATSASTAAKTEADKALANAKSYTDQEIDVLTIRVSNDEKALVEETQARKSADAAEEEARTAAIAAETAAREAAIADEQQARKDAINDAVNSLNNRINNIDGLADLEILHDETTNTLTFNKIIQHEETNELGNVIKDKKVERLAEFIVDPSQSFINTYIGNVTLIGKDERVSVAEALAEIIAKFSNYSTTDEINALLQTIDLTNYVKIDTYNSLVNTVDTLQGQVNELASKEVEGYRYELKGEYDSSTYTTTLTFTESAADGTVEETIIPIIGGGGGGGSSSGVSLSISRITDTPLVVTKEQQAIIRYDFSGTTTNASGEAENIDCIATWSIGGVQIGEKQEIVTGQYEFDVTDYLAIGSQKVTLTIVDWTEDGVPTAKATKTWTIQQVDISLDVEFKEELTYPIGEIAIPYIAWGSGITKTVHFVLDGEDVATANVSTSGVARQQTLTVDTHGAHLLDMFISFETNGNEVSTEHVYKTIVAYDSISTTPIIGCSVQDFTIEQYDTKEIPYTVWWNQSLSAPTIVRTDGETITIDKLEEPGQSIWYYSYVDFSQNDPIVKNKTLQIGYNTDTETIYGVSINATINKLDIDIEPVTAGLVLDFNPAGKTNIEENKEWSYEDITMTPSKNFDWINGGYQTNDNGQQYFCIKAGSLATFNYKKLFADDIGNAGREFKLVFKVTNVKDISTPFFTCLSSNKVGIIMKPHEANIYNGSDESSLYLPYSEDDKIEFEFNIAPSNSSVPAVIGYEDGVATRAYVFDTNVLSQAALEGEQLIFGSENCDVHIYRLKVYKNSLTDEEILNNFITDAGSATEIRDRYKRNQIYVTQGNNKVLTPEGLAVACPWLRIIKISAPNLASSKDPITNSTIEQIYLNGREQDNWIAENVGHACQGTSSMEYGFAGYNLDLILREYNKKGIIIDNPKIYQSSITFNNDGSIKTSPNYTKELGKVSLTDTSIPVDYFNIKVNIASSDNANNAELARRYNQYNPYVRPFENHGDINTQYIKDTMEFHNCVVFIQETGENPNQFSDGQYHFYAIGNIGDSKKTDDTRMTDPTDYNEVVLEILDVDLPLSDFPKWDTAKEIFETVEKFDEESTYGWRYDNFREDSNDEVNAQARWIDLYKIIVNANEEIDFYKELSEWFVLDSALYYYLFTERYTMVDNRAKNSFWHFGKTGKYKAITHPALSMIDLYYEDATEEEEGAIQVTMDDDTLKWVKPTSATDETNFINTQYCQYRWDLAFDYDNDTALGIDNTGAMIIPYGVEDTDVDLNGKEYFRESDSTFFCNLRDNFKTELRNLFIERETKGAWSSSSLINQWENAQEATLEEKTNKRGFPEALWREDIRRKYIRPFTNASIDNSIIHDGPRTDFLMKMMNGRKKYYRRQFERNQEMYMSGKYSGTVSRNSNMFMRFTKGDNWNFDLTIIPYANCYIGWAYTNPAGEETFFNTVRAYKGDPVPIEYTSGGDLTKIYSASMVQSIGDLSRAYVYQSSFAGGTKLQELILGNGTDENYNNPYSYDISVGNPLLEYIDVQKLTALTRLVNLNQCLNLKTLKAYDSGLTIVDFGSGAKLETIELPATVTRLTMNNLNYLTNFSMQKTNNEYSNLARLIISGQSDIALDLVQNASNLEAAMIYDVDWKVNNNTKKVLDTLYNLQGIDSSGGLSEKSVLTGTVTFPSGITITSVDKAKYEAAWPELDIIIANTDIIPYHKVIFANWDNSVYEEVWVENTKTVSAPVVNPTKPSDIDVVYTFAYWSKTVINPIEEKFPQTVTGDRIYYAIYTGAPREYTVRYVHSLLNINTPLYEAKGEYGDIVDFVQQEEDNSRIENGTPIYRDAETNNVFRLFSGWDKSGLIDGKDDVKIITTQWDELKWTDSYDFDKDLSEFSTIELYAYSRLLTKIEGMINKVVPGESYNLQLGYDYTASDINSYEIVKDSKIKNGDVEESTIFSQDKYINTDINLFEEDRDFTLAIEYTFNYSESYNGPIWLLRCHDGSNKGLQILKKMGSQLTTVKFNEKEYTYNMDNRDILVFRYKKANPTINEDAEIYLYSANLDGEVLSSKVDSSYEPVSDSINLILGGSSDPNNRANGNIHWMKMWYADLGDSICKNIANYTHINLPIQFAKNYGYEIANNSDGTSTSMTFLASQLLDQKKAYYTVPGQVFSWDVSSIREFINSRIYKAIPEQFRSLIKLAVVNTRKSDNNVTGNIVITNDYLYLPSIKDLHVGGDYTSTAIDQESTGAISYLTTLETRIRANSVGEALTYFTRTPTNNNYWVYRIDELGNIIPATGSIYASAPLNILIMFSI